MTSQMCGRDLSPSSLYCAIGEEHTPANCSQERKGNVMTSFFAKWLAILGLSFVVVVVQGGCSRSVPSERDGERVIRDRILRQSEGRIRLLNFKKTNGQDRNFLGVQLYSMEYEVEFEFTESCKWVTGFAGEQTGYRTARPVADHPTGGWDWDKWNDDMQNPGDPVQKGQRKRLRGEMVFQKTERGWKPA